MKKLMLGLMMAFAVTAEADIVKNYDLGNGLKATLDDQGVLTINGNGATPNWKFENNQVWYNEHSQIKSVVAEGEITVGENAFLGCDKLTSVSLPNATTIGSHAFRNCKSLTSVILSNVVTIEGYAFQNCPLDTISLPKATTIGTRAFVYCTLTSVSLPNATTIGDGAFTVCRDLKEISLPNATTIGARVFELCLSLTSASLPNATTIGECVFGDCDQLKTIYANATMATEFRRNRGFYGIGQDCVIVSSTTAVEPHPAEHTTAKAYTNGVEVTDSPIEVLLNATVDVVFTADYGYCFKDYTTVQTNTVTATDDPTEVDGPEAIRNLVVIEPYPAEHSTATIYTNGVEVTDSPIEVLLNATVEVVFTVVEEGYCFEDHSTAQTNTVTATDDPTKVDGPMVVKIPSLSEYETQQARYVVQEAEVETNVQLTVSSEVKVLPSVTLKSGDTVLDQKEYEYACEFYGIPKQTEPSVPEVPAEPTADDLKVVSKDAQVVQTDEIAVKKESIAAPSAGTVKVEDNKVQLGVTVLKTSDLTAEKKEWGEVALTAEDVKVVDGKIVISVPVDSASGFMVIQTKDAAK